MFWSSWKICHFDVIHKKTYTIHYKESSAAPMGLGCGKFLTNLKYYLGSNCTKHFLCNWIVQNVFVKCIILLITTLALGLEQRLKHDKGRHWENVLRFKGYEKMSSDLRGMRKCKEGSHNIAKWILGSHFESWKNKDNHISHH
jgi:hypothetical protein